MKTFNPIKVLFLPSIACCSFPSTFFFQSYQGSIFTPVHSLPRPLSASFNPIKVLFLRLEYLCGLSFLCTFNPIKVLFLHDFDQVLYTHMFFLSILSRFYFYSIYSLSGQKNPLLSILSRFYFYDSMQSIS